ncbi:MAG TPA: Uma2 family endonuclease [Pyrinomonadaceae bacterium]|nr:Uma2 family endonuclease [Pyrinomonadaceae bacterium]
MSAQIKPRYSLEDYFELERTSEEKWEWFNGEVFCMSGVSPNHGLVEINFAALLSNKLEGRNCRVFPADIRIKTPVAPPYRYADLSVLCGRPIYENIGGVETLTNPELIVEVLSRSTEAYDRGDKFTYYKSIPSLREYLLVAQHRPHISQFVKQSDDSWNQTEVNDLAASLYLPSIDCTLALNEVNRGIEFGSATPTLVRPEDLV